MKITFATALILLTFNLVYAQSPIVIGNIYQIDSHILDEEREIWIGLPSYYDSTKSYPTIFVLDAEWQFDITLALAKELTENGKIPAHIVVGIPKVDNSHRFKDLTFTTTLVSSDGKPDSTVANYFNTTNTCGGKLFYEHLVNEVMPFIQAKFKTNGFDVFIGHSLSGYFGAYILSMDGPFNAFQLYDPSIWYNDGDVIKHLSATIPEGFTSNVFITTAAGGKDQQQFNIDTHARLNEMLKKMGMNSELKVYENENHGSVRLPSLIDGLTQLYTGFSIGYILPTDTLTVADAENHYTLFSKKVNYTFTCPADVYRWIGFANHSQGNWVEAIKAYNLCLASFTNDLNVPREAAECYFELEEFELSLELYKKALSLDPSNASLLAKTKEVEQLVTKPKR